MWVAKHKTKIFSWYIQNVYCYLLGTNQVYTRYIPSTYQYLFSKYLVTTGTPGTYLVITGHVIIHI